MGLRVETRVGDEKAAGECRNRIGRDHDTVCMDLVFLANHAYHRPAKMSQLDRHQGCRR